MLLKCFGCFSKALVGGKHGLTPPKKNCKDFDAFDICRVSTEKKNSKIISQMLVW